MYRAPIADIAHTLNHVAGLGAMIDEGLFPELSADLVDAILEEAGRFAADRVVPLRETGDRHGAKLKDGHVTTAPGWKELYTDWAAGGWNAVSGPVDHGGQGLPLTLNMAALEMWNSGSMAFALCPTLTMGAAEALEAHGTEELKAIYLEKLVTGEWTGTMNLTEPQAGSDLNALRARAEPRGDGTYRIFGQKIFITYGEHDMTDNIVHLVLARLPDAPPGTRGISLFLVPKFLVNEDGSLGARNDAVCGGLEHKLGIHASPTCTMLYGDGHHGDEPGAIGWLVGEENRGLACMFTMMNNARLAVGMQGVAIAEAAYQKALAFAHERRQGRAPGEAGEGMSAIVAHGDVQRMLLTMKALTGAVRAINYSCAAAIDRSRHDTANAEFWTHRANLLTPIAKAFATDVGCEAATIGVQVHGGMGFIEETGAAMLMRDARIAPIYEGTNGIQAIDLVGRKLPLEGGAHVHGYIGELRDIAKETAASNRPAFGETAQRLTAALDALEEATTFLQGADKETALAGATPYLRLFGLAAGGAYLAKAGLADADDRRARLARFYAENLLDETRALAATVTGGAASLAEAAALLDIA
ncbi:MAG: acyl-CoA dehydrogenase C-terminal domain-containing protein [Brucellaceae bacterium]|nr:acyl-CoA dehydrogenase C-terminal domain-containing protein [Brucellaceae bacterium]